MARWSVLEGALSPGVQERDMTGSATGKDGRAPKSDSVNP